MKIGWIGLGKLGLPCALALEQYGYHEIIGYDINPQISQIIQFGLDDTRIEAGMSNLLSKTNLKVTESIADVVSGTEELIFVAVQTPHHTKYGGEVPMPNETMDFDYKALGEVIYDINLQATDQQKQVTVIVISTALPGTMKNYILPKLGEYVNLVYNPFFIAMGTTIQDYLAPEFILLGVDEGDPSTVVNMYRELFPDVPLEIMSLEEAELTKVAYNTFISMKIVFANTLMEICDKVGANVDNVTGALAKADRRITSSAYLSGGMGDGGACHPRDNIAMSWLAEKLNLSCDPFAFVTRAREEQSLYLVKVIADLVHDRRLPVVILGKAYKPESDLTYGSPALLLDHQLREYGIVPNLWDPFTDDLGNPPDYPAIYFIATKHKTFKNYPFPERSVVIDPHRYIEWDQDKEEIEVIPLGARNLGHYPDNSTSI